MNRTRKTTAEIPGQKTWQMVPYTNRTKLGAYAPLPKGLLHQGLSPGAILVYCLLLDRGNLSQRSGWFDEDGWIFVIYPISRLCLELGKGASTIKRWLRELEEREFVHRTLPTPGMASRIYLNVPEYTVKPEKRNNGRTLPTSYPGSRGQSTWDASLGGPTPEEVERCLTELERINAQYQ